MALSSSLKNVATGSFNETQVDQDVFVLTYQNETAVKQVVERYIDSSFIQFHFCLKGKSDFIFNNGTYTSRLLVSFGFDFN